MFTETVRAGSSRQGNAVAQNERPKAVVYFGTVQQVAAPDAQKVEAAVFLRRAVVIDLIITAFLQHLQERLRRRIALPQLAGHAVDDAEADGGGVDANGSGAESIAVGDGLIDQLDRAEGGIALVVPCQDRNGINALVAALRRFQRQYIFIARYGISGGAGQERTVETDAEMVGIQRRFVRSLSGGDDERKGRGFDGRGHAVAVGVNDRRRVAHLRVVIVGKRGAIGDIEGRRLPVALPVAVEIERELIIGVQRHADREVSAVRGGEQRAVIGREGGRLPIDAERQVAVSRSVGIKGQYAVGQLVGRPNAAFQIGHDVRLLRLRQGSGMRIVRVGYRLRHRFGPRLGYRLGYRLDG